MTKAMKWIIFGISLYKVGLELLLFRVYLGEIELIKAPTRTAVNKSRIR